MRHDVLKPIPLQGRVVSTDSPDTGVTGYAYDQAGNLRFKTDAKGVRVEYTYDNLNRVTAAVYPDSVDDLNFTYDQGTNGKGHLTTMNDPSGVIAFGYDPRGRLVQKTSTISGINYPVTYVYTPGGKVSSVTYPSGRVVTNTRNALGQISSVNATGIGDLVSNLSYRPFGGPLGLTNGFGGTVNNVAGECDCLTISNPGQPRERTYGYDANRNLTSITGTNTPWYSQAFEYDQLNRLTSGAGRYGTISYTYDDVGNRLTRDTNGTVETYTYSTGMNRLQQITGGTNPRTFAYDSNGNITGDGILTFIYDQNNQLIEVEQGANPLAEYVYNGLGQRVKKVAGGVTTIYHYDLDGKLIAESLLDGTMTREYLYMGKVRVAMVDVAGGNALYHYLNDRLGTPEILTDATGTVAWEAWYEPFGEAHLHPSSSVVNNIRLPGQYFDAETGYH
jgi:YD repeat-containing protein